MSNIFSLTNRVIDLYELREIRCKIYPNKGGPPTYRIVVYWKRTDSESWVDCETEEGMYNLYNRMFLAWSKL